MSTDETAAPPHDQPGPGGNVGSTGTTTQGLPPLHLLRRSKADRKLAGVAGGLGRYLGVDPLILRILFVVLTIFGGSGILLYVLGWLLIAEDGEQESPGQRLLRGHTDGSTVSTVVFGAVVLILGLVFMGSVLDTGPGIGGIGVMATIAVILVLLLRNGQWQRPAAAAPPPDVPYGPVPPPQPGSYGQTPGTAYATTAPTEPLGWTPPPAPPSPPAPPHPPVPPAPPRERSLLGRLTLCTALTVVGLMLLWNAVSDGSSDDFRAVTIFSTALAIVAIGLIVGAFMGRSRGLIVLGVVLAIATAAAAATDQRLGGGIGKKSWTPRTVAAAERPHELGIGDAELDLTRLPAGSDVDVDAQVGIGGLWIYVPYDATVIAEGQVGAGNAVLLGHPEENGTDVHVTATADPVGTPGSTKITIDAEVGFGQLKVVQR